MSDGTPLSRREALVRGGSIAAGAAVFPADLAARLSRIAPQEAVVPWLNRPEPGGRSNTLDWQALDSWITPTANLFRVSHYPVPEIAEGDFSLRIGGLVDNPLTLSMADIKAMPRESRTYTLECAGNRGFPSFIGAVHNAEWIGTPLRPILERAGIQDAGIEVVFFGADAGEEELRDEMILQNFGRSMSVEDAMNDELLLAYEVNGEPLPADHGFPLRLITPGWYGVANVKWLDRIDVWPTRYQGRFMARDYVTLREQEIGGEDAFTLQLVGRTRINSFPAKVTRVSGGYRIHGAAWGADIASVEVRVDDGPWRAATLGEGAGDPRTWTFWSLDWDASSGEHSITTRATDRDGYVQPTPEDPIIAQKKTYWESNGQFTRQIAIP